MTRLPETNRQASSFGCLYVVATPIGNPADISTHAVAVLQAADLILCEELKEGSRLLKQLGISAAFKELNEHNESSMIQDVLVELMNGKNLALISDCGTPVFSDPGRQLIQMLYETGVKVIPIPGASSLMSAISVCPFNLDEFYFAGFLPPKTEARQAVLRRLAGSNQPIILMDTPYRLGKLLDEVSAHFGKKQPIFLACDLTLPGEQLFLGEAQAVSRQVQNRKAEFILIIDRPRHRRTPHDATA